MKQTDNLKMNLPEESDVVDIEQLNDNFRVLDAELSNVLTPVEVDLSSVIEYTPSKESLEIEPRHIPTNIGDQIKQASIVGLANVAFMLKMQDSAPERVTFPMFGIQNTSKDGKPSYLLQGTYAYTNFETIDITVRARIAVPGYDISVSISPWGAHPIYLSATSATPDGAFLRLRNKEWVAESVPVAEEATF